MLRTDLYWQKISDLKVTLKEAGYSLDITLAKTQLEDIENALSHFRGTIQQLPPIYSAIKVDGKKLYEYFRP